METLRAMAEFPYIAPENFELFKEKALLLLNSVKKQKSILRYDLFFDAENSKCVILEEYEFPDAVIEHVRNNAALLEELSSLGGKIKGSMFPLNQNGDAISEIRENWDSKMHFHFAGK
jgi:quinol monooxygenase YgiN